MFPLTSCPCISPHEEETFSSFCGQIIPSFFHSVPSICSLLGLLGAILLVGFIFKRHAARQWVMQHLMGCAVTVFLCGVMLYVIGFSWEGTQGNAIALLLRSVTASMEMFVSESELIEVHEVPKSHFLYMTAFAIVHFLAICISAAFVIHVLGTRAISFLRMSRVANFRCRKDKEVYVFFDISDEAVDLAKSIHTHHSSLPDEKKRPFRIIFVRTPKSADHNDRFSFGHLLSMADNRNERLEELIALEAFITYSRRVVTLDLTDREWRETVGLNRLRRYLDRRAAHIHFFCLSPDEKTNIATAVALHERFKANEGHVDIYSHVNPSSVTDTFMAKGMHFIDSASLAVMELKEHPAALPAAYVLPDPANATATRPFNALIIGLGATGTEVLKFLYESAALPGPDGTPNPFSCHIVDPHAHERRGMLAMEYPILHDDANLHFLKGRMEDFAGNGAPHSDIAELISTVDCIALTTDSDDENLRLALLLVKMAQKVRPASRPLGIYVGASADDTFNKAARTAEYCRRYAALDISARFAPADSPAAIPFDIRIIPFGAKRKVFTYDNIVNDKRLKQAMDFHHAYMLTGGLLEEGAGTAPQRAISAGKEWRKRQELSTPQAEALYSSQVKCWQQEQQDMANVWHITTKLLLMGAYVPQRETTFEADRQQKRDCFEKYHRLHPSTTEAGRAAEARDREAFQTRLASDDAAFALRQSQARQRMRELYECIDFAMQKLINAVATRSAGDTYAFMLQAFKTYEEEKGKPAGTYSRLFVNLARCEHLRWNVSNALLGFTPGPKKDYLRRTHPCLVSCEELEAQPALRDTIKYDFNTIWCSLRIALDEERS